MPTKIQSVGFGNFTVFTKMEMPLSESMNILIGPNGTGKTHILKAMYVFLRAHADTYKPIATLDKLSRSETRDLHKQLNENTETALEQVFLPDQAPTDFKRSKNHKGSYVTVKLQPQGTCWIDTEKRRASKWCDVDHLDGFENQILTLPSGLFIPAKEVMSIYPGFVATWLKRHSNYDRTYFDLCLALQEAPLRKLSTTEDKILAKLEEVLGGNVIQSPDGRFYVETAERHLSMHMLAEGLRKFAMLAWLIKNGELLRSGILFWDEPENNLNPRLMKHMKDVLYLLVEAGLQICVATHDYLLANEISLEMDKRQRSKKQKRSMEGVQFISLYYGKEHKQGVQVEIANLMTDLEHNPILEEYAAHYERETEVLLNL